MNSVEKDAVKKSEKPSTNENEGKASKLHHNQAKRSFQEVQNELREEDRVHECLDDLQLQMETVQMQKRQIDEEDAEP